MLLLNDNEKSTLHKYEQSFPNSFEVVSLTNDELILITYSLDNDK